MKSTRTYTMRARAEQVAQTRNRIIEAMWGLTGELPLTAISLEAVAIRAGVSVQTVLRQFGSRAGLVDATREHAGAVIAEERRGVPGDRPGALRALLDHYERRGDAVLLLLAQERSDPVALSITEQGREMHRTWVRTVFEGELAGAGDSRTSARELEDLLVVATDVFTWKLLRRDRGLSRDQAESRITRLVEAVLADVGRRAPGEPRPHGQGAQHG